MIELNDLIKKSKNGKGYYCNIKDGKNMIATQGNTVLQVFENLVDAYKVLNIK